MALDFPNSPTVGEVYTGGGGSWSWDGYRWNSAIIVASGPFLPLAGGTLSGPVISNSSIMVNGAFRTSGPGVNVGGDTWAQLNTAFGTLGNSGAMGIGWNYSNSGGETDFFLNRNGGNVGGLNIYDFPNTSGAVTLLLSLTGAGALTIPGSFTVSGGVVALNNATSNWILWPNAGLGPPSSTARSPGTRLIFWPGANNDYALGMESGNLWFSTLGGFTWYNVTPSQIMSLGTTGNLTVTGEFVSTLGPGNYGGLRLVGGNYGAMLRQDGATFYILLTASGTQYGAWNALRPFMIDMASGVVTFGNGPIYVSGAGDPTISTTLGGLSARILRFAQAAGDEASAGKIDYGNISAGALSIVGKGPSINNRSVIIYDNLTVQNVNASSSLTTGGSLTSTSGHLVLHSSTNNVDWQWYVDGDMLRAWRGFVGDLFHIDNGGNTYCVGEAFAEHSLATHGYVWVNGVQWSNASGYMYCGSSVKVGDLISLGNVNSAGHIYCNSLDFSNYAGFWYTPNGVYAASQIRSDSGGDALYAPNGDVTVGGVVRFGGMYWQNYAGYAWCPWSVHTGGSFLADGGITTQGRMTCNADFILCQNHNCGNDCAANGVFRRSSLAFGGTRGARIEMWGGYSDYAMFALESGGPNGGQLDFQDGSTVWYIYATGVSDARLKTNIRDTKIDALAAILATPVRAFEWNELGQQQMPGVIDRPIGLVAQELEATMPDTVFKLGNGKEFNRLEDTKTISTEQIVPYLFRAIQQMAGRIEALEAELGKRH